MALFSADRRLAQAISDLVYSNPFLPERIEAERRALGDAFDESRANWNLEPDDEERPNVVRALALGARLLDGVRARLVKGGRPSESEGRLYEDVLLFVLYHRHREGLDQVIAPPEQGKLSARTPKVYAAFTADAEHYLGVPSLVLPAREELAHIFACFFQIRRAFRNIFHYILGVSRPAARLRAMVWQSIFTHDMRRYRRVLYERMADYTTLITGPSGTGKELVARAVGLSRYIPFQEKAEAFAENFAGSFFALNLSALSPTLIESELFGHRRGSFTGAAADHAGWLEVCPPLGTVFLDEIGELDPVIQVKLLRVLEGRTFSRLGETEVREFRGKIAAATNRDLARDMRRGAFREDLYYRLCSDIIPTPSLRERLADNPAELRHLVTSLARRIVGIEAAAVAREVEEWIEIHLGSDYPWPGNVRELEQCVRNLLVRREYRPAEDGVPADEKDPREALATAIREGKLTAADLLARYCALVYRDVGSYEQAARRLQLDRRTVKAKVNEVRLREERGT